jgi:hypothetical protein
MKKLGAILAEAQFPDRPKNLSTEFQVYGVFLAEALADTKHYSLYIKLAKECERGILEDALSFVKDADGAKSKPRLFMWKLKQLRDAKKLKMEQQVLPLEAAVVTGQLEQSPDKIQA